MAECSKALATIFVNGTAKGEDDYRKHVDALLEVVSSKRKYWVKTYKLKREHLVDIEDVFLADRRLPLRENERHLSGLDGLIVAMARILKRRAERNGGEAIILTGDKRMARVCAQTGGFPIAVDIIHDEIPGT